jgi:radical SAM superfamily enzyme YgiQ (UPF0313 family)
LSAPKRLVLYLPLRSDPKRDEPTSADLLPLELLQIAGGPDAEGFEVVLIDANVIDSDPLPRLLEACDGALLLGCSAILGYQVHDGRDAALAVRERFPDLPIVWGGWFPSVVPELYFEAGIADAVVLGQGELTFLDLARAVEARADLEGVSGLALPRDGAVVPTPPRPVVGFDALPALPWHLLDFEPYRRRQLAAGFGHVRHRMPFPAGWSEPRPPVGFALCSSFGCPSECTFCCSPLVTPRRWEALGGADLAALACELRGRFGFDLLRFNDANWGVSEPRAREFSEGLAGSGQVLWWNATIEVEAVLRYDDATLDLMAESGCHLLWLGAETGTEAMQRRIRKRVPVEEVPRALERLVGRGITTGCFWIIGYPGEGSASMWTTLRKAAATKYAFRGSASDVYPFRAVPGTADFEQARRLGWELPATFEEWGRCFEWKWNTERTPLPPNVRRAWSRFMRCAAHFDRTATDGPAWLRALASATAGWRLRTGRFGFPVEQKLLDLWS